MLITAHATLENAIEVLNQGAFAYHLKPLDLEALKNSVSSALREQRLLKANRELLERLQRSNRELEEANRSLQATTDELQRSEARYRTLVERAADGIFTVEPHSWRILEANPRMEALTGYTREELLNDIILPVLHPETDQVTAMEVIGRAVAQGEASADYLSFEKRTGERIAVDLNCSLLEWQGDGVVLGIARDITERRRAQELVRQANLKLQALRSYEAVHAGREEERKKLAGDLHDDTLGEMARLAVDLTTLTNKLMGQPEIEEAAAQARENLRSMERRLRDIVQGIYPSVLTNLGLLPAIASYLHHLADHPIVLASPLEVTFKAKGFGDERLPETVEIALYRTMQQGLANVIAHAQATKVTIELSWEGSEVAVAIADNGKGLDPDIIESMALAGHFGIATLRYRAEGLGGSFRVESQLGSGTTLMTRIPVGTPGTGSDDVKTISVVVRSAEEVEAAQS